MPNNAVNYFFIGLLLAVIALTALIFLPFLTPLVLAGVLAVIFKPFHRWLVRNFFGGNERSSFAALVSLVIIVAIVFVPIFLIAGKIYTEVQQMYAYITDEAGRSQVVALLNDLSLRASSAFFGIYSAYSFETLNVTEYLQTGLRWIFSNLDKLFASAAKMAMIIFVMLLAVFYILRDGAEFRRELISLSPLVDADDERIFGKLEAAIYSIVVGRLIVGVLQGLLTGIGFAIFDVPNPAVWGSVAAVAALIPGIGTALVLVPGVLYLLITGSMPAAIGLLVWGVLVVGLLDNFIGPILIKRGVKIHSFLILLSVLGGLTFFGPVGFVLGPLALALLFALLEIYRSTIRRQTVV